MTGPVDTLLWDPKLRWGPNPGDLCVLPNWWLQYSTDVIELAICIETSADDHVYDTQIMLSDGSTRMIHSVNLDDPKRMDGP